MSTLILKSVNRFWTLPACKHSNLIITAIIFTHLSNINFDTSCIPVLISSFFEVFTFQRLKLNSVIMWSIRYSKQSCSQNGPKYECFGVYVVDVIMLFHSSKMAPNENVLSSMLGTWTYHFMSFYWCVTSGYLYI